MFDFDETLAVTTGAPRSDPVRVFGGRERLSKLAELLRDLRRAGVRLSVCSYNSRQIFEPLLQGAGIHSWFDPALLIGYEAFEKGGALHKATGSMQAADDWDKGTVMKHVIVPAVLGEHAERALRQSPHHREEMLGFVASSGSVDASTDGESAILFCDDDPANIRDVRTVCASCATLFVPRQRHDSGLQASHMAAIRAWARIEPAAAPQEHSGVVAPDAEPEAERSESPQPPPLRGKRPRGS